MQQDPRRLPLRQLVGARPLLGCYWGASAIVRRSFGELFHTLLRQWANCDGDRRSRLGLWSGERAAFYKGSPAPQTVPFSGSSAAEPMEGALIGSEDCLHLTVWSPQSAPPSGGRPALVWLDGGGNLTGNGDDINASRLATTADLVIVCVTHRLGLLGWFVHDALAGASGTDEDRSGNFGTLDQIAALKWVRDTIAVFGGDPGRVTIAGQSSGGWNVRALLSSPLATGLFHRAIIQSTGSFQLMSQSMAKIASGMSRMAIRKAQASC
jgi:para-nitrobenzyl esterase